MSCPELDFSANYESIIGARMMDGRFGGCTINIIHKDDLDKFIEEASLAYFKKFKIKLTAFEANPSGGTSINMR